MPDIVIYTKPYCPYCNRAKALFKQKDVPYTEINIQGNEALRTEMVTKSGGSTTVPQIFINGKHIGGCDDMYALQASGKLDGLLG
jgi:glutaredoxin 3